MFQVGQLVLLHQCQNILLSFNKPEIVVQEVIMVAACDNLDSVDRLVRLIEY